MIDFDNLDLGFLTLHLSNCCSSTTFEYCIINHINQQLLFGSLMVLVHGVEYAFGAHEHSTTGIFEVEPKHCPGFTFRKSILIARSDLGPKEVRALMEKLAEEYPGNSYNLISRNCNHFCNDVCLRLAGKQIPSWVNRLARLGMHPYYISELDFSCFFTLGHISTF